MSIDLSKIENKNFNTIWVSDLHIGTTNFKHDYFLEFLKALEDSSGHGYRFKKLYLVGDILDVTGFDFKYFIKNHRKVIQKLIRIANKVETIFISGNHEMPIWDIFDNSNFNGITLTEKDIHIAANGKKYLVIHGDQFDGVVNNPFIYALGDKLYYLMHLINNIQNKIRLKFGYKEFSFAHWIKTKTKSAIKFVSKFEQLVVNEAKKEGVEAIILGHSHMPDHKIIDNIEYINDGTFCEICSCAVEHEDGTIEVIRLD